MTTTAPTTTATTLEHVPLDQLHPHPENLRGEVVEDDGLRELAASIRERGLVEPIVAAPPASLPHGTFTLTVLAGHRRLAACRLAGVLEAPVIVRRDLDPEDLPTALATMLVENLQREDLTPLQEARGYAQLRDAKQTQQQIADAVGRHQSHISKRLRLLKLPPAAQALVESGTLPVADAVDLAALPKQVITIAVDAIENGMAAPTACARAETAWRTLQKRDAEIKTYRDAGIPIIEVQTDYPANDRQAGPCSIAYLSDRLPYVDGAYVHPTDLPCYAIRVTPEPRSYDPTSGQYRYGTPVCSDPASHPLRSADDLDAHSPIPGASPEDEERRARIRAENEAREARAKAEQLARDVATAARDEAISTLLAGKLPKQQTVDHLARWQLLDLLLGWSEVPTCDAAELSRIHRWTGHEPLPGLHPSALAAVELERAADPIIDLLEAGTGGDALLRLALARALAAGETLMVNQYRDEAESPRRDAHLRFLTTAAGYTVTDGDAGAELDLRRAIADTSDLYQATLVERACRDCGCTELDACPDGCSWAPDDGQGPRCTSCATPDTPAIEDVHLPEHDVVAEDGSAIAADPAGVADVDVDDTAGAASHEDLTRRHREAGVTTEALADASIRGIGLQLWLSPKVRTARGRCIRCDQVVGLNTGGRAAAHKTSTGDKCPGAGEVAKTRDAVDAADRGEPAGPPADLPVGADWGDVDATAAP